MLMKQAAEPHDAVTPMHARRTSRRWVIRLQPDRLPTACFPVPTPDPWAAKAENLAQAARRAALEASLIVDEFEPGYRP